MKEIIFVGENKRKMRGLIAELFGCTSATVTNALRFKTNGCLCRLIRQWVDDNLIEGIDYVVAGEPTPPPYEAPNSRTHRTTHHATADGTHTDTDGTATTHHTHQERSQA